MLSTMGMVNVSYWTGNAANTANVAASGNFTYGAGFEIEATMPMLIYGNCCSGQV
jgi:hypothetical protein